MQYLYPDLDRPLGSRPPSLLRQEALEWACGQPVLWTPERPLEQDPVALLAIIGAMVLSAHLRQPSAWDGANLRGRCDLQRQLADAKATPDSASGYEGVRLQFEPQPFPLELVAAKLWSGRITLAMIHQKCVAVLRQWQEERMEADPDSPSLVAYGRRTGESISATGYDDAIVSVPMRDGFSAAKHPNIRINAGRPMLELLALVGAQKLQASGRWVTKLSPSLPEMTGIVLRDTLDLDRWLMIAPHVRGIKARMSGKRFYLAVE